MINEQPSDLWYWWAENLHPVIKEKKKQPIEKIKTMFANFSKKASALISKFVPDVQGFVKLFQKGGAANNKKITKKRMAYFENFKIFLDENKLASSKTIALIKYLYLYEFTLQEIQSWNIIVEILKTHKDIIKKNRKKIKKLFDKIDKTFKKKVKSNYKFYFLKHPSKNEIVFLHSKKGLHMLKEYSDEN